MAAAANGTCSYPREQVLGTLYGQAVGDAIGLLTEFLSKQEAHKHYHEVETQLELEHKKLCNDLHRVRWKLGDWTDDTDQMVLIMQSFVDNAGAINPVDVARKLLFWTKKGYPELGDHVGMGIGDTTDKAMQHPDYPENPTKATFEVWDLNGRNLASNGGVMRTSIVGVHQYWDTDAVEKNAAEIHSWQKWLSPPD